MTQNIYEFYISRPFTCGASSTVHVEEVKVERKGLTCMTDLQVKYHSLEETKRANEKQEALKAMQEQTRAREAAAQERQASVAEREMSRKEGREKYERAKLLIDSAASFTQGMNNLSSVAKNVAGTIGSVVSIGTKVATSAAGLLG